MKASQDYRTGPCFMGCNRRTAVHAQEKTFKIWWCEAADSAGHRLDQGARKIPGQASRTSRCKFELKTFDQMQQVGQHDPQFRRGAGPDRIQQGQCHRRPCRVARAADRLDDIFKERGWGKILNDAAAR